MNQASPDMYYPSHLSGAPGGPAPGAASGPMGHYSAQHAPPSMIHPTHGPYTASAPSTYGHYAYPSGLTSPQHAGSMSQHGGVLALPPMGGQQHIPLSNPTYVPPPPHAMDTTGQQAPHGMKPRVTATLWEDEGSLCFQVEAKGVCVARREDNGMINGTKLLNVAGMTRGRRDGILKSEKQRHVVKIGPMHLKGVWIPFERALDFANKEKITDQLYPLFVHDIAALLYHPTNQSRTNVVMAAAERRKAEQVQSRNSQGSLPSITHQHSMPGSVSSQQGVAVGEQLDRPDLHRAHTFPNPSSFPTPPTSASGMGAAMDGPDGYHWTPQNMSSVPGSGPLAVDTGAGINNTRSMPTTPATTPPGNIIQSMQYQQGYEAPRPVYHGPPNGYQQPHMARYGPNGSYIKSEMGPPLGRVTGGGHDDSDPARTNGISQHESAVMHGSQAHGDEEAEHENDTEYTHNSQTVYDSNRPYTYAPGPSARDHLHQDLNVSPTSQGGIGRATPRTTNSSQSYYQQGYNTPPQILPPSSNLYNVMSSERGTANPSSADEYPHEPMTNGYSGNANGNVPNSKRCREDEEDFGGGDGMKRRRTINEDSVPGLAFDGPTTARQIVVPRRR